MFLSYLSKYILNTIQIKTVVCRLSVSPKLHVQNKFPRDVVVRSELTAAGSAGDGYFLPGMHKTFYLFRLWDLCMNCDANLILHVWIYGCLSSATISILINGSPTG